MTECSPNERRPRISAVICTHNRAGMLCHALRSLVEQTLPVGEYEIIVVDNASTDGTREAVEGMSAEMTNLRYVAEPRVGLSIARNTGTSVARAPYVAYLDDDARADPRWLEATLRAFEGSAPSPAAVGGRVWLDWDGEQPAWLPLSRLSVYTYVDHGDRAHVLADGEYLVGANMALRKDALSRAGGFEPRLGRHGSQLLSGEEAAVVVRLQEAGEAVLYAPEAVVWHSVLPERRRRRWLFRRMYWDGASQPLIGLRDPQRRGFFIRQAGYDVRRTGYYTWCLLRALVLGDGTQCMDAALCVTQRLGRLRTHILLAFCPPKREDEA